MSSTIIVIELMAMIGSNQLLIYNETDNDYY